MIARDLLNPTETGRPSRPSRLAGPFPSSTHSAWPGAALRRLAATATVAALAFGGCGSADERTGSEGSGGAATTSAGAGASLGAGASASTGSGATGASATTGSTSTGASATTGSGAAGGTSAGSSGGTGGAAGTTTSTSGTSSTSGSASTSSSTSSTSSTSSSSGGVVATGPSKLPTPPGSATVPKPSGSTANLKVLPWAGFKSADTFTFDDSQPSQIAHYAELQAVGVPMTFYVSTGNSGEAGYDATFTQAVHDGHEIGNHTVHHCQANLTGCSFGTPLGSLGPELDQCTAYIPQHFGQSAVWTSASPFGDTGYDSSDTSRFFLNRGVSGGTISPDDSTDPFNLPCHLAATGETASSFNAATDAAHGAGSWLVFLIHTIQPTTAVWYNPVAITDVTGAMTHARSLGDVWVGTLVSVGAYWRGQKVFSAVTPVTAGGNTTWTWTLPAHFPAGSYLRVTVGGGTLTQGGVALPWVSHGYYEVALDAGSLTWAP